MRMLHTMLRVASLEKSLDFYTNVMGMKLLRESKNEQYRYTLAFVGYADESEQAVLELTWNWDTDHYDMGTAYGHVAFAVEDIYGMCDDIKARGGNVYREPGPVLGGSTVIAFVRDPDGYAIELIADSSTSKET